MHENLQSYQEHLLRGRAESAGECEPLAVFLALRGDTAGLDALVRSGMAASPAAQLLLEMSAHSPADSTPAHWPGLALETGEPWLAWTVARVLLHQRRTAETLALAKECLARDPADTLCLNLAAHALHADDPATSRALAEASLRLNPEQADVANLLLPPSSAAEPIWFAFGAGALPPAGGVSFYLPLYGVERFVAGAIKGVLSQGWPVAALLAVDDASPDASAEIARQYPVQVVAHAENRGLAAARNTAFHSLPFPLMGAIDTDAVPDPMWVCNAMAELLDAPPEVAGAGGRLVEQHIDTPADLWRAVRMPQGQGDRRACPRMLPGANTLFRRDAVMSVGGYNPERRTNGEDSDLCRRLEEAGFLTVYTPRAVAFHLRTDTVASVLKTIWGWAYWTRVEAGSYNSPDTIIEDMPALVAQAAEMMRDDLARGAAVLTPVTYAYPAVQMMLDLRHGAGRGFWSHGTACTAQGRVARLFAREMEARIPGMGAWLAEHLDQVMTDGGGGESALPPALETALRALEGPVAALAGLLPNQSSG